MFTCVIKMSGFGKFGNGILHTSKSVFTCCDVRSCCNNLIDSTGSNVGAVLKTLSEPGLDKREKFKRCSCSEPLFCQKWDCLVNPPFQISVLRAATVRDSPKSAGIHSDSRQKRDAKRTASNYTASDVKTNPKSYVINIFLNDQEIAKDDAINVCVKGLDLSPKDISLAKLTKNIHKNYPLIDKICQADLGKANANTFLTEKFEKLWENVFKESILDEQKKGDVSSPMKLEKIEEHVEKLDETKLSKNKLNEVLLTEPRLLEEKGKLAINIVKEGETEINENAESLTKAHNAKQFRDRAMCVSIQCAKQPQPENTIMRNDMEKSRIRLEENPSTTGKSLKILGVVKESGAKELEKNHNRDTSITIQPLHSVKETKIVKLKNQKQVTGAVTRAPIKDKLNKEHTKTILEPMSVTSFKEIDTNEEYEKDRVNESVVKIKKEDGKAILQPISASSFKKVDTNKEYENDVVDEPVAKIKKEDTKVTLEPISAISAKRIDANGKFENDIVKEPVAKIKKENSKVTSQPIPATSFKKIDTNEEFGEDRVNEPVAKIKKEDAKVTSERISENPFKNADANEGTNVTPQSTSANFSKKIVAYEDCLDEYTEEVLKDEKDATRVIRCIVQDQMDPVESDPMKESVLVKCLIESQLKKDVKTRSKTYNSHIPKYIPNMQSNQVKSAKQTKNNRPLSSGSQRRLKQLNQKTQEQIQNVIKLASVSKEQTTIEKMMTFCKSLFKESDQNIEGAVRETQDFVDRNTRPKKLSPGNNSQTTQYRYFIPPPTKSNYKMSDLRSKRQDRLIGTILEATDNEKNFQQKCGIRERILSSPEKKSFNNKQGKYQHATKNYFSTLENSRIKKSNTKTCQNGNTLHKGNITVKDKTLFGSNILTSKDKEQSIPDSVSSRDRNNTISRVRCQTRMVSQTNNVNNKSSRGIENTFLSKSFVNNSSSRLYSTKTSSAERSEVKKQNYYDICQNRKAYQRNAVKEMSFSPKGKFLSRSVVYDLQKRRYTNSCEGFDVTNMHNCQNKKLLNDKNVPSPIQKEKLLYYKNKSLVMSQMKIKYNSKNKSDAKRQNSTSDNCCENDKRYQRYKMKVAENILYPFPKEKLLTQTLVSNQQRRQYAEDCSKDTEAEREDPCEKKRQYVDDCSKDTETECEDLCEQEKAKDHCGSQKPFTKIESTQEEICEEDSYGSKCETAEQCEKIEKGVFGATSECLVNRVPDEPAEPCKIEELSEEVCESEKDAPDIDVMKDIGHLVDNDPCGDIQSYYGDNGYKNTEYYKFNQFSFYDIQTHLAGKRNPQPDALASKREQKKGSEEEECKENKEDKEEDECEI